MKASKRAIAIILAILCFASAFSVNAFAATKYKSYGGKYGKIVPVKDDYKTVCKEYEINGAKGAISFSFKSKGYEKNVYYGITIYSDEQMQNILINIGKPFPSVNSYGDISIDFSPLQSGIYYGIAYTFISKDGDYIVDKDSVYTYRIKVNKVGASTVKITEATALSGINYIQWDSVKYANGYFVYRKKPGEDWEQIAKTKQLSYKDKVSNTEKYYYMVRAYDENSDFQSAYNKKGVPLIFLAPPVFGEPEYLQDNEIKINWQKVPGATSYRVYKKIDGSYKRLAILDGDLTEFTDSSEKENNSVVYYKVRAYDETSVGVLSEALKVKVFGVYKPKVTCNGKKATVKWDSIDGAEYSLFKKEKGGKWVELISRTDSTEFFDKDLEKGKAYYYSLLVHKGDKTSSFDSKGVSVRCLADAAVKSAATAENDSVEIKWSAVSGATEYKVFKKAHGGKFELIGKTTRTVFYDISEKKNNLYYEYTVQALNKNSTGEKSEKTKSVLYMKAPELSPVKYNGGNVIKWSKVSGATAYGVYRRTPSGDYKKIAEVASGCEYVDTSAKKGAAYYYTVKAVNGKYVGAYEIGEGINCLNAPELLSASENKSGAVSVKWEKVSGATGYYVYRKTESSGWSKIGKTSSLSFADKAKLKSGEKYIYTVKAYNEKGSGIYNSQGIEYIR